MLDKFLALEDATPADVEKFVFDHGPIAGCIHLRAHNSCAEVLSTPTLDGTPTSETLALVFWEAPVVYRAYAQMFRTILTIAADVQAGGSGDLESWASILASLPADARGGLRQTYELGYGAYPPPPEAPREFCRDVLAAGLAPDLLASSVYMLMTESPVVMGLRWPLFDEGVHEAERTVYPREAFAARPLLRLVGDTFGVLTYQLASALQGSLFAICSNCNRTYAPTRKPQSGRTNYCPACRDVRKLDYKRRRRASERTED